MKNQTAASAYKQTTYESAPPLKLVHMMYEGALRFLDQAQSLDPKADKRGFEEKLRKANAVIFELRVSLDHETAPDLCRDLTALYLFTEERIRTALMDQSTEALPAATKTLTTLLEGWKGVEIVD